MKTDIFCKNCYVVVEYDLDTHEPKFCKCGMKYSAWHIDNQLRSKGLLPDYSQQEKK